jgi:type II secretory pathway component PulF
LHILIIVKTRIVKKEIEKAIIHSRDVVQSGKKLSDGLKDHKKNIPSIMIKLIEAGEKSGSLEKSMQDISVYFDYQVGKMLVAATVLLEPIILIFTAVLVGGMMISVIAPIYGLIGQVGTR